MPLDESQQREVAQLMLVARACRALAAPRPIPYGVGSSRAGRLIGSAVMGQTTASFTPGARLSPTTWARALREGLGEGP